MDWSSLADEFLKSVVTVPVTIAAVWFAFRLETRRRAMDNFTAQLASVRSRANGVSALTSDLIERLDDEDPPSRDASRRAIASAVAELAAEASTASSLGEHVPRRWYPLAYGLSERLTKASLDAYDDLRRPPTGPGTNQWMADFHRRLQRTLGPCEVAFILWHHYRALGHRKALKEFAKDHGADAVRSKPRSW